jgi:hypothetical protein
MSKGKVDVSCQPVGDMGGIQSIPTERKFEEDKQYDDA